MLGAGGSARAAVWALINAGARRVEIWNRTATRARALAAELQAHAAEQPTQAEILVNCTSIGLDAADDPFKQLPVSADGLSTYLCVVDLVYAQAETRLIQAARARAVPVVDGLALLVGQGALSFEQFTGRPAPIDVMWAAVSRR